MLDTVRLGCRCEVGFDVLAARGWACYVRREGEAWDSWAKVETAGGVHLTYLGGHARLMAEVSLPRLLLGDNAGLLDWAGCVQGFDLVQGEAAQAVGCTLPAVSDWHLNRADAVWAWDVDPTLYVAALRWARLPRTEPRSYETSVSWVTRTGKVRGRCYDKRVETGRRDVGLPLRLEREARPWREVVRVEGKPLPRLVGELGPRDVVGLVSETMHTVGLDAPIPGPFEARRVLVESHGARRGRNLWRVLREAQDFGGCWPSDVPASTRRRYQAQLREAGIRSLSWAGELSPLDAPRAGVSA